MSRPLSLVVLRGVFASGVCDRTRPIKAGEMFSVLPQAVLTFDYETPNVRVSDIPSLSRIYFASS